MAPRLSLGLLFVASLVVAGCSGSAGKITGSVTLDGQPLTQAMLSFAPADKTTKGNNVAETDEEGNFEVKPNPKTRVTLPPGKYNVFITKLVDKEGNVPPPPEDPALPGIHKGLKNMVPRKYAPGSSPVLEVVIKPGDNQLPAFELTSKAK